MKQRIRDFVCKTTFSDPKVIKDDARLFDEDFFDSMGLLNLISFLDEDFNVKVEDAELDTFIFGFVNSSVSYLERALNEVIMPRIT